MVVSSVSWDDDERSVKVRADGSFCVGGREENAHTFCCGLSISDAARACTARHIDDATSLMVLVVRMLCLSM